MSLALGHAPEGPMATRVREGHFQACKLLTPVTEMIIVPDPGTEMSTAPSFVLPLGTDSWLLRGPSPSVPGSLACSPALLSVGGRGEDEWVSRKAPCA